MRVWQAYRLGIEAVVEEEDLVVDIGTGSGHPRTPNPPIPTP